MSLFGGKKRTVRPDYTGLQVQTASSALPIPIVYGTNRIAPNVIWSDGFQTHAQRRKNAGGKGGGGRRDMAQAGGPNGAGAEAALDAVAQALTEAA